MARYYDLDAYRAGVRRLLFKDQGRGSYRKVQLVTMPSFSAETAVYIRDAIDGDAPTVVYAGIRPNQRGANLWEQMTAQIEDDSPDRTSYRMDRESEEQALAKMAVEVQVRVAPITEETAALLDEVWIRALRGVRYVEPDSGAITIGTDGVRYCFASFVKSEGYLGGEIWSPREGTRMAALTALGALLGTYALAADAERALEARLRHDARALLARLE